MEWDYIQYKTYKLKISQFERFWFNSGTIIKEPIKY